LDILNFFDIFVIKYAMKYMEKGPYGIGLAHHRIVQRSEHPAILSSVDPTTQQAGKPTFRFSSLLVIQPFIYQSGYPSSNPTILRT
jgi:hypothetical protein